MPTPACEDIDTIARRIAELRKDELDNLNCLCRRPDGGGPVDSSKCPVHGATTAPIGWGEPIIEHRPDDDWEALREMCGWCIPAMGTGGPFNTNAFCAALKHAVGSVYSVQLRQIGLLS